MTTSYGTDTHLDDRHRGTLLRPRAAPVGLLSPSGPVASWTETVLAG